MATKVERFTVGLTAEQVAPISLAAVLKRTDVITFALTATLAQARNGLANRRRSMLDAPLWSEFDAMLNQSVSHKPRLETFVGGALHGEPSP